MTVPPALSGARMKGGGAPCAVPPEHYELNTVKYAYVTRKGVETYRNVEEELRVPR